MPSSLHEELKALAEENHFLDISEEIRSLLRDKWMEHQDPYALKLSAIKHDLAKTAVPEKIQSLRQDLAQLLEEINDLA